MREKYENLVFIIPIIAETVCSREFKKNERVEKARLAMTPEQVKEFGKLCDDRCRAAYETKAEWFQKCVSAAGNVGRDRLYVLIAHWMQSYLYNPERFRAGQRSYVSAVNAHGEGIGPSHVVIGYCAKGEALGGPVLACGASNNGLNWTISVSARTPICKRCANRS